MSTTTSSVFLVLFVAMLAARASAQNITKVLAEFPQFSTFNKLLSETGVADQINSRKSLTLLCPDNSVLDPIVAKLGPTLSTQQLADILGYHVLLQYFDLPELHQIVNGTTQVTTLYQTTGRAEGTLGFVNITNAKGGSLVVSTPAANDTSHATIVKSVKQIPYNYSLFQISAVVVPEGVLSQTPQPTSAPVPAPSSAPSPLSPVPIVSPVPAPASSPEPSAAPTPSPEAAPVPSAVPTPSTAPVKAPVSSPPAPVGEGPSVAETPSAPSSALHKTMSHAISRLAIFLGAAMPFFLQL